MSTPIYHQHCYTFQHAEPNSKGKPKSTTKPKTENNSGKPKKNVKPKKKKKRHTSVHDNYGKIDSKCRQIIATAKKTKDNKWKYKKDGKSQTSTTKPSCDQNNKLIVTTK